jgi:spermidine synthase
VQASSEPQDMRLQRMLGHLTTLVPENPRRVLVIGCGAGVTAGAVSVDPLVQNETIAEIEPLVPRVVSKYFAEYNYNVVANPKVNVHLDDARHYLLTTKEKFDAITSDPLDPWVRGAATLYTREFFDVAKAHLNPGGVVTLFVQLYESSDAAVKSEVGTFLDAFPGGVVFANTSNGLGYDLVLLGQVKSRPINVDAVQARLTAPANAAIAKRDRHLLRDGPVRQLRRPRVGHGGMAARGLAQSRSKPPASVPGGTRPEPVPERRDLPEHDQGQSVPGGSVRGITGDARQPARGDQSVAREVTVRLKADK